MDLYALPPAEFTAARDATVTQARADKDPDAVRALKALRRPSLAAYAVNRLVRDEPALLDELLNLGSALSQAQSGGDAPALRQLGTQRHALVEAVTDRAAQLTDGLGTGPRAEVVATLEAAMADPNSADAVRTGRLVRALSYAGFGGADLADAVAPDAARARPDGDAHVSAQPKAADQASPRERTGGKEHQRKEADRRREALQEAERQKAARREAIEQAEAAMRKACGDLDDAVGRHGRAQGEAEASQRANAVAEGDLHTAAQDLEAAERALARYRSAAGAARELTERARQRAGEAVDQVDATGRDVTAAQQATDRAQRHLDALRRP